MNVYERAIEEFNNTDEDGQHKTIYAYFGLATYFSQCIEETFTNMLILHRVCNKKIQTNNEVNILIDSIEKSKLTMGPLINEVKQAYSLSNEIYLSLQNVLKKRNYIVHKYFKNHIEKFSSDIGKTEMLQYFCTFITDVKKVDTELEKYYLTYQNKLGITDDIINLMLKEMKETESKRDR